MLLRNCEKLHLPYFSLLTAHILGSLQYAYLLLFSQIATKHIWCYCALPEQTPPTVFHLQKNKKYSADALHSFSMRKPRVKPYNSMEIDTYDCRNYAYKCFHRHWWTGDFSRVFPVQWMLERHKPILQTCKGCTVWRHFFF